MTKDSLIQQAFEVAAERYAAVGVDVRKALEDMKKISLSLHCWQADDVSGFENQGGSLTGGIQVTGNYPGRARTIDELRRAPVWLSHPEANPTSYEYPPSEII